MATTKTKKTKKSIKHLGKPDASKKAGLPPGTLMHIGKIKTVDTSLSLISYNAETYEVFDRLRVDQIAGKMMAGSNNWIRVTGLQNTAVIGELTTKLGLHPLLAEDILNTGQRPKVEIGLDYIFLTMKAISDIDAEGGFSTDQVTFILRDDVLMMFAERELDLFEVVYQRMQLADSRFRSSGLDYLLYALVDVIVDHYFNTMEHMADVIDAMEDNLSVNLNDNVLLDIQQLKKDLLLVRKMVFPLREALGTLIKTESHLIDASQKAYFNDVYDHVMHINETVENYRDLTSGLKDIYLSTLNLRMSRVMQTLTIISTIFIPLTFIVGVYGMNFENMPELRFKYGYIVVWLFMITISLLMVRWFRKHKWL